MVSFVLKDGKGNKVNNEHYANNKNEYYVFWYDAKMKNYLSFLEYVFNKRYVHAKITGILIIDKKEYLDNIEKIKKESKNQALKDEV